MRCTTSKENANVERNTVIPKWRNWCRLCAKEDTVGGSNVDVYLKDEGGLDVNLATAIGKYFWVHVKTNDTLPQKICLDCHNLVTSLVAFTERVNKVQTMLGDLQKMDSGTVDSVALRRKYGLVEGQWQHMMKPPEVMGTPHLIMEEVVEDDDGEVMQEFVAIHNLAADAVQCVDNTGSDTTYEYTNEDETESLETIMHPVKLNKREIEEEFQYIDDEEEALDQLVSEAINAGSKEMPNSEDTDSLIVEEHVLSTLEGDDEGDITVDSNDLYKELKYDVNDEEYEPTEILEDQDLVAKRHNPCEVTTMQEYNKAEGLRLLKRKRGRPRKCDAVKRPRPQLDRSESDYDPSGQEDGDNVRKYECCVCGRQYKNPTSYRKHMMELHSAVPEIPQLVCEKCPERSFPTERQLAAHKRTHLPLEEKLDIPCPYCPKKFTKVAVMRQHVNGIHFNEKPYICDACGRALKTLAALNEHKLVHTEDCPYECDVCHKRFKNKARLKIHSDIHTETMYECTVCKMELNTRRTLKMHMLVHSNEKQYKCNFCPAAFKRTKALKNHLILHTGMRPYKCNFCDKAFSNGSNCRSHKRKMHSKELAEEEAAGKKCEPTTVPKLDELRISSNVVPNLRDGVRIINGVQSRRLLTKNGRAKCSNVDGNGIASDEEIITGDLNYENINFEDVRVDACDEGEEDDEEDGEGEENETVIYEIIEEI